MKNTILSMFGLPAPTPLSRLNAPWNDHQDFDSEFLVDLRMVSDSASLSEAKSLIKTKLEKLEKCGKLLLVGVPISNGNNEKAIYQRGLSGITKSLAKEIGHKGQTVNLIRVSETEELRSLPLVISFLTSNRSAFISGQELQSVQSGNNGTLKNSTCLVTGGAGGIGLATSKRLASEGANVIIVDIPMMKDRALHLLSDKVIFVGADLTNPQDIETLCDKVKTEFGSVDVLINNAGITRDRTLKKMSDEFWNKVIEVNLNAVINLSDSLLEQGLINEGGTIINTSSISGIAGNFGQTNYTATKAGVIEMARVYAKQLASKGITVNAIAPGYIQTDMVKTMPAMTRFMAERLTCLLQAGTTEDIAEGMAFLAHPGSRGINGQVLRICGGSFLGA